MKTSNPDVFNLLLVADPQLQGVQGEAGFPLGSITRWDSDRFLYKGFSWAMNKYGDGLDAVVFLGDLIDEGSSTKDKETFLEYVYRFRTVFPVKSYSSSSSSGSPLSIYTSGDNDVGGEGEPVTKENVDRFKVSLERIR